jgi:hypothetical protein
MSVGSVSSRLRIVNDRAVILDYGIRQSDGRWKLASDPDATYATRADVMALAHAEGTEWRAEELGFNPYANLPVERIGVRFTDGQVVDYTVQVTDQDGTFYVWARNLDRALQLEWKTGDSREFALRNYAVNFDTLDEVNKGSQTLHKSSQPHDSRRAAAAASNDNSAWPERTFIFLAGRAA